MTQREIKVKAKVKVKFWTFKADKGIHDMPEIKVKAG